MTTEDRLREARPHRHNTIDFGLPPKAPFLVVHSDHGDTEAIRDAVMSAIRTAIEAAAPVADEAAEARFRDRLTRGVATVADYDALARPTPAGVTGLDALADAIAFGHNLANLSPRGNLGHTRSDWRDCPQPLCVRVQHALAARPEEPPEGQNDAG